MTIKWQDGKNRCHWANPKNALYIRYHDKEWGVPLYDDKKLFEMLILECFQAVGVISSHEDGCFLKLEEN